MPGRQLRVGHDLPSDKLGGRYATYKRHPDLGGSNASLTGHPATANGRRWTATSSHSLVQKIVSSTTGFKVQPSKFGGRSWWLILRSGHSSISDCKSTPRADRVTAGHVLELELPHWRYLASRASRISMW